MHIYMYYKDILACTYIIDKLIRQMLYVFQFFVSIKWNSDKLF